MTSLCWHFISPCIIPCACPDGEGCPVRNKTLMSSESSQQPHELGSGFLSLQMRPAKPDRHCDYSLVRDPHSFPGGKVVKFPPVNARAMGLIPGLGRFHMLQDS